MFHLNIWIQFVIYCTYHELCFDFDFIQLSKYHFKLFLFFYFPRYHIKYMFVGDILKVGSETIIRRLRPALQMRLRFITHLNVDQITAPVSEQHV